MSDVLSKYNLCNCCLIRQFPNVIKSYKNKNIQYQKYNKKGKTCTICTNLMTTLDKFANDIIKKIRTYEFNDFLIGAIIPTKIMEKEDEFRAKYKLKGGESIKKQITRELNKKIAKKMW